MSDEILDNLRGYAYRRGRGFGLAHEDAEDAAQLAAVKVWQALPRLRPNVDPWPFLTVVARQEVARHTRRVFDRPEAPVGDLPGEATRFDPVEEAGLAAVEAETVRAAVATLPPVQLRAVVGMDLLDYSSEELGERWGREPSGVRAARRRGHERLRGVLAVDL